MQELRRAIRADAQPVPRIGDAARLFFTPLEPFLIDGRADHKRIGRIARVSLEPIWEWIGRDLIPAEAKALGEDINRALLADDRTKADQLVRALHERAILRMTEAIAGVGGDEKARRRLAVQVGTPRAIEDLEHDRRRLVAARRARRSGAAAAAATSAPSSATRSSRSRSSLDAAADAVYARTRLQRAKPDVFLYGLILVMNRLAAPWQLIRIATRAAESDDTARIAETPYAAAVTIVLGETESMVGELRAELKAGRPVVSMLKAIHDAARGLRSEMDMSVDSAWSRQLAAIRSRSFGLAESRKSRRRPASSGACCGRARPKRSRPARCSTAIDVNEAEMRVEFVGACRHYASELAVNEVTMRAYSELTLYLETGTKVLLDSLRHAGDADRPFRQSQVDAAIRFCRTVFGAEYAGLLAKAAEVAVQAAPAERKPRRA